MEIRFWKDCWAGPISLMELFQDLYARAISQNYTVKLQWLARSIIWKIQIRRPLILEQMDQPDALNAILSNIKLSRLGDMPMWKLSQSDLFTIESLYNFLNNGGLVCPYHRVIWKAAISIKV